MNVKTGSQTRTSLSTDSLVVCRPFLPTVSTDLSPHSYLLIGSDGLDPDSVLAVAEKFQTVLVERTIARALEAGGREVPVHYHVLADVVQRSAEGRSPRVVFLASNDTHAHFMMQIARQVENSLFVIPNRQRKDEGASKRLGENGIDYVEIDYADRENAQIAAFKPDLVFCAADWTSEFIALHAIARSLSAPCVALQEGPQDWRMKIKGKDPLKYRNAEILFAQGPVTLRYIRPKYFAVTGNPKTGKLEEKQLPPEPRVFINCNFTYGEWEDSRETWMSDVLSLCHELELDYLISKHPRDTSEWDDPNLVESSAFTVKEQLLSCSLVVSRFSSIPYEGLSLGRQVVYYNPHGETPRTFNEDRTGGIFLAYDRQQLRAILERHKRGMVFDRESAHTFLQEHCGPQDGRSLDRIVEALNELVANRLQAEVLASATASLNPDRQEDPLFSIIICTHNRAHVLDRVLRSVIAEQEGKISFEVLVVDNASTDDTFKTIEAYLTSDLVRYVEEPALGLSRARNTGVKNSKGRFVVFLDDDGEVEQGWLEAFLMVFEEHPQAIACGGRIIPKYEVPKPDWISGIAERFYGDYDLGDEVKETDWIPGGNSVWRKETLESLGGYDMKFGRKGHRILVGGEESQLIKQARGQGLKIFYSPDAVMYHYVPGKRVTVRYLAERWLGQGISDFRYREVGEKWSRALLLTHLRIAFIAVVLQSARLVRSLFSLSRGVMIEELFQLAYRSGILMEALRFGWTGEYRDSVTRN